MGLRELIGLVSSNDLYYVTVVFLLLILVIWILILIFRLFVNKVVLKTFARREHSIEKTEGVFVIIIFLVGVDVALQRVLYQENVFFKILYSVLAIVITVFVAEISAFLLEVWGGHMGSKKGKEFQDEILPLTKSTVKVFLFVIALVIILDLWGVKVWTLLASIGVAGIIIGLALNDSLKNVFGGISLILDRTFRPGDVIELEDKTMGEVVMINLRSTRILTHDEKIVSVPNSVLANTRVMNYSQPSNLLRLTLDFSIAYGSDIAKAETAVKDAVAKVSHVLESPKPDMRFDRMDEYALVFKVDVFLRFQSIRMLEDAKDDLTRCIYATLTREGITIPYPTKVQYSVLLDEKTRKEMHGKRSPLRGKL